MFLIIFGLAFLFSTLNELLFKSLKKLSSVRLSAVLYKCLFDALNISFLGSKDSSIVSSLSNILLILDLDGLL